MIDEMKRTGMIDEHTWMPWAMGEIALHPQRTEILSVMSGFNSIITSNCTIYDESIARHLALGKSVLNCSLDSGTRKTYHRVKGKDYFDRVIQNLKRLSKITPLELKYIFLPGINDNEVDVDGFVSLIDDILPSLMHHMTVILSRDTYDMSPLSSHTISMMARLSSAIHKRQIPIRFHEQSVLSDEEKNIYLQMLTHSQVTQILT